MTLYWKGSLSATSLWSDDGLPRELRKAVGSPRAGEIPRWLTALGEARSVWLALLHCSRSASAHNDAWQGAVGCRSPLSANNRGLLLSLSLKKPVPRADERRPSRYSEDERSHRNDRGWFDVFVCFSVLSFLSSPLVEMQTREKHNGNVSFNPRKMIAAGASEGSAGELN
ncbi:hypothetical protein SKAU_G00181240 [Synaphobranchus kaupii]|uniref:Uncharacterized protein n=1 Tax=Synaphobranchus kaupii TaxID=118154 RepID=A0A9Q1FMZ9_SYNKA|nr:hypothetical protein SKAU_G00181240 [Synaphobranchus kaupii]